MKEVVIVSAKRTPIGSFGGAFKDLSSIKLGEAALKAAIQEAGIEASEIDEVIFGNVLSAGYGQNIARQITINIGLPETTPAFTINKVCGSGLKAVALGVQSIMLGDNDVVAVGGTESMSGAKYIVEEARWGMRMGDRKVVDTVLRDGLLDSFQGYHMGITAENIAEQFDISREDQDQLALESQLRAEKAIKEGRFKDEIVPVEIPQRRGPNLIVDQDEYPRFGSTIENFQKLKPAFKKEGGSVTAGNASGINDGAAVLILMSKEKAEALGLEYLVEVKSYASAGVAPEIMGTGPIPATQKALEKAGCSIEDIDLIEANEAFAVQALSVARTLNFDMSKVNVNGGAISLGHPIGASGARILVTLLHEMKKRQVKKGLATLCIGGGQGIAMVVERNA